MFITNDEMGRKIKRFLRGNLWRFFLAPLLVSLPPALVLSYYSIPPVKNFWGADAAWLFNQSPIPAVGAILWPFCAVFIGQIVSKNFLNIRQVSFEELLSLNKALEELENKEIEHLTELHPLSTIKFDEKNLSKITKNEYVNHILQSIESLIAIPGQVKAISKQLYKFFEGYNLSKEEFEPDTEFQIYIARMGEMYVEDVIHTPTDARPIFSAEHLQKDTDIFAITKRAKQIIIIADIESEIYNKKNFTHRISFPENVPEGSVISYPILSLDTSNEISNILLVYANKKNTFAEMDAEYKRFDKLLKPFAKRLAIAFTYESIVKELKQNI